MNKVIPSVSFGTYSVYSGNLNDLTFNNKTLINTINQYSYCIAQDKPRFKLALLGSDILLPDGMGVVAAIRLLSGKKIKKIAGADIHQYLLQDLNQKGGKCFYLGSSENTLSKIVLRLAKEYPNVKVKTFSPVYRDTFTDLENSEMCAAVNTFQPDVLFIGMTAPKQEKWAFVHKEKLNAQIICSIGAVFDFYAETVVRPNSFWIRLRLEWFIRLIKEPRRMWKRYLLYGPVFIGMIIQEKFRLLWSK